MNSFSTPVYSNQRFVHPRLPELVRRHLTSCYQKPYSRHTQAVFDELNEAVACHNGPLILDSGCGVGESARRFALAAPSVLVIGIDKSINRLLRAPPAPKNCRLVRADIVDFWRLAAAASWRLSAHYLLYPNPWPKATQVQRRWHGSPVWPSLLALGGRLELRTNWRIYAQEFVFALEISGFEAKMERFFADQPITAFERKYQASEHSLWRCRVQLA